MTLVIVALTLLPFSHTNGGINGVGAVAALLTLTAIGNVITQTRNNT